MIVLVDEAHGPHLPFSENLPVEAIAAGADLVAQSTHKIGRFFNANLLAIRPRG